MKVQMIYDYFICKKLEWELSNAMNFMANNTVKL